MPKSDIYTFAGSATLAAAAATALGSLIAGTTIRGWVVGVRVEVGVTAAAAGNDIVFTLARPGNTPTGTGAASSDPHDFSAPASIVQQYTTWSTAPTIGTILARWTVPQVTGAMWSEFPPTDYEWQIPAIANAAANAGVHLFATPTVATSTPVTFDIIYSE